MKFLSLKISIRWVLTLLFLFSSCLGSGSVDKLPYHQSLDPEVSRTALIEEMSLTTIEDYLRNSDKVFAMHNEDDLILEPGEIEFIREVFGDRARIYRNGGHLGNIQHRELVDHMIQVFTP